MNVMVALDMGLILINSVLDNNSASIDVEAS